MPVRYRVMCAAHYLSGQGPPKETSDFRLGSTGRSREDICVLLRANGCLAEMLPKSICCLVAALKRPEQPDLNWYVEYLRSGAYKLAAV